MSGSKDIDLYRRGVDTAIAARAVIARGSRDAAVVRAPGVAAGVFPHEPERSIYNNAVLEHGLGRADRAAAIDAMEVTYATAEGGRCGGGGEGAGGAMRGGRGGGGDASAETTGAMGMALA